MLAKQTIVVVEARSFVWSCWSAVGCDTVCRTIVRCCGAAAYGGSRCLHYLERCACGKRTYGTYVVVSLL